MFIFFLFIFENKTTVEITDHVKKQPVACIHECDYKKYLDDFEISSIFKFTSNLLLYYQNINAYLVEIENFILFIESKIKSQIKFQSEDNSILNKMYTLKNIISLINRMEDSNISFGIRRFFFYIEKILLMLIYIIKTENLDQNKFLLSHLQNIKTQILNLKKESFKMMYISKEINKIIFDCNDEFKRKQETIFTKYMEENMHLFNLDESLSYNFFTLSYILYFENFVDFLRKCNCKDNSDTFNEAIYNIKFARTRAEFNMFRLYLMHEIRITCLIEIYFFNSGLKDLCSPSMLNILEQIKNYYQKKK